MDLHHFTRDITSLDLYLIVSMIYLYCLGSGRVTVSGCRLGNDSRPEDRALPSQEKSKLVALRARFLAGSHIGIAASS